MMADPDLRTYADVPCSKCGAPVRLSFLFRDDGDGSTIAEIGQVSQVCGCRLAYGDAERMLARAAERERPDA